MNTIRTIAKNTIALLTAQILSKILHFFYVICTARYLGARNFGILSFALAFTAIFGFLTDLGLGQLTIREVARDKSLARKYLGNVAVIKIILAIVIFGLIVLIINLLGYPKQTIKVVYLLSLSVMLNSFISMFSSIFRAFEKMEYDSIRTILNSLLLLVGALFAINHGLSIVWFASLYFLVSIIMLGYSMTVSLWVSVIPKIEIDLHFWKEAIKQAWPFGAAGFFAILYYRIDSVMLSMIVDMKAVGWYNAAYNLVLSLTFIPQAFLSSMFPVMSRLYILSTDSLRYAYERSFRYMFIIGFSICIGTTLLAVPSLYLCKFKNLQ